MPEYRILSHLLHLLISVYMTCRVHQCCDVQSPIHIYLKYDIKTEHRVMAKKLKICYNVPCVLLLCARRGDQLETRERSNALSDTGEALDRKVRCLDNIIPFCLSNRYEFYFQNYTTF